jgi:hypothetical protein
VSDYNKHESFENRRENIPLELSYKGVYRYVLGVNDAAKLLKCRREDISKIALHGNTIYGVKVRRLRFMGDLNPDAIAQIRLKG